MLQSNRMQHFSCSSVENITTENVSENLILSRFAICTPASLTVYRTDRSGMYKPVRMQ
jgi:hypothetical protein